MDFINKKIITVSGIMLAIAIFVSVAFAALASNLNISFGNVTQNALSWNVGFKGSSVTPIQEGTSNTGLSCGTATVTPSTVTISDSTLSKPGDKCTYALTIQNTGDIAAALSAIAATEPTGNTCTITNNSTMVCGYITYQLTTTSGSALTAGITINKKEMYNIQLIVTYSGEELNASSVTQSDAKFTLTYSQAENRSGTAAEGVSDIPRPKKCKRATTLHTATCTGNESGCYNAGYYVGGSKNTTTITYGSLGTSGTLTAGDAFDCDVNGDGTYDSTIERFYYLSKVDGDNNSNYAALIYYTNVIGGVQNTNDTVKYDLNEHNYEGPTNAYLELPTTTQWPNVSLSNQTRQIYAENNESYVSPMYGDSINLPQFTYTNRAARLISHKEINSACDITIGPNNWGALSSCEFLLENGYEGGTNVYFYWIESPASDYDNIGWMVLAPTKGLYTTATSAKSGVRPVIEVSLNDIEY